MVSTGGRIARAAGGQTTCRTSIDTNPSVPVDVVPGLRPIDGIVAVARATDDDG
jgi:hypothetical protein